MPTGLCLSSMILSVVHASATVHNFTKRAIDNLRWVGLQARAAAVEHRGLCLRPDCLWIAAAAPLLPALEAPAMIPAEELPVLNTPYAERCKSARIAVSVN